MMSSFSSGSTHQLLEDGLQFNLTFDSAILTALEVDPAFVESVQHLYARQWMLLTRSRSNSFVSCMPLICRRIINNSNRIARSNETFLLSLYRSATISILRGN